MHQSCVFFSILIISLKLFLETAPTLTINNNSPTDGDSLTLTCTATQQSGNNFYQFRRNSDILTMGASPTYTIHAANIDDHDGSYICVVLLAGQLSDPSTPVVVACKLLSMIVETFGG